MKKNIAILLLILVCNNSFAQLDSIPKSTDYSFIIQDSPSQLFTMRQFNQNYLSGYRLFAKTLNSTAKNEKISELIQLGALAMFLMPLTHEEGHRSILTVNNIGSISQPFFNKKGAAYVKGVTDKSLQELRDKDLPNYIRLHSAGLESDYMLTRRMETMGAFNFDNFQNYKLEYIMRKFAIIQYFATGLFKYQSNIEEEKDELERDIVGHDIYGAARHLFRPTMNFYRYTRYKDLTNEEQKFVNRLGYRSLLNLLNPLILGINNFKLNENTSFNLGMGYTMSPFGDFIDENIWIKYKTFNIGLYFRQFQNRVNWFNSFGISINEYKPIEKLSININTHIWQQPINYDFNTSEHFTGGAVDIDLRYFLISKRDIKLKAFSIDLGLTYKTKGFLPEELYLDKHFGLRIGTTIRL